MIRTTLMLATMLASSNAFYLPGVAPNSFENGEDIELKVN
jgi:hypothetical protein